MSSLEGVPFNSELGVVTQHDGDTGDSAQRTATLFVLLALAGIAQQDPKHYFGFYSQMMKALKVGKGRYRRSPVGWAADPLCFTRDQHSILMLAMAVVGNKIELKESMMEIFKRFCLHQNFIHGTDDIERKLKFPDPIVPTEISVLLRGMDWKWLKPLLWILDLGFLYDLRAREKALWDYDNMMAQNLMYAVTKYPTPIAKYAYKKYAKTDFLDRIKNYHNIETENGVQGMFDLFQKAHDKTWRKVCET